MTCPAGCPGKRARLVFFCVCEGSMVKRKQAPSGARLIGSALIVAACLGFGAPSSNAQQFAARAEQTDPAPHRPSPKPYAIAAVAPSGAATATDAAKPLRKSHASAPAEIGPY